MKKNIICIIFILISLASFSQAPQKISYQAVIRDASNNLMSLKNISMRISILKGTNNGAPVYIEMQQKQTNLNGLVSLQIGAGSTLMGKMKDIDWANGPYFVLTETDPDGGFDYRIIGSSELLSVPYALFSANSTGSIDTNYLHNSVISLQNQAIENKNNILKNLDSIQSNAAQIELNVNNIQFNTKNIKNNLDTLNSKISTVDFNSLISGYQKVGKFVTSISLEGTDSFDIKINGNLIASKNVTVGGNIESLGATSTLGTLEKPFKGLFISSGSLSIASDTLGQNVPPAVLSNVRGNLQISAGGLKLLGENSSFIAPNIISTLTGNASTATKLKTAHTINGILFDGTSDIVLPGSNTNALTYTNIGTGDVPGGTFDGSVAKTISYNSIGAAPSAGSILITTVGSLTSGAIPYSLLTGAVPIWNQSTNGNAATASKLSTAKLINGVAFDGTTDIIIASTSSNALSFNNAGTGDIPGETYNGSIAKSISYNSIGAVASNTAITAATKTKLTYDTKGLVTAGTDATTADIAASTNKNYVTDIQSGVLSNTSGTNTGDESTATIQTKLGITTLSGSNTGDETNATIKTKLGITTLSGSNTGDQILPTLISLGAVASNTAITAATKTKLSYDTKGLVTAGADATTADIAASTNKNYVTDVQVGVLSNTSGTNTGDETTATIQTKLGITTLSGSNTGDETNATIKTKLGITTLSGSNTGDQILPTLISLGAVATNTAITAATKTKLSYDTKGLVTAGTDATTADIAASTNKNYVTDIQSSVLSNTSGTNTGDETTATIQTKLGITTLSGSNSGDETNATIKTKLGITTLSGSNTGDETSATIKTKLGITTLSGSNTGDQILPTLESLGASPLEGSDKLTTTGLLSKLTVSSNKSEEQSEEIDLSKCIHKLSGIRGRHYILKDGIEGQIIYITPFGDRTTFSDINIDVENGTIWVSNQLLTSNRERPVVWSPFNEKYPSKTMATAIFSENRWFISGGTSSY